jgi:hypothetical protein
VNALTASYFITSSVTNAATASYVVNALTASYFLTSSVTSASFATTASNATTASYALNGGVTQIIAGTNVTISPTNGLGAVTINSTGGSGNAFPYTGSAQITGSLGVTGSFSVQVTGSVSLVGLSNGSTANTLYYNTATGQITYASPGAGSAFPYTGSAQITGSLGVTGSLSVTGLATVQSLSETSAKRFKTNITPLESQLDNIDKLNPVTFNWIEPSMGKDTEYGLIAEELMEVYPELVQMNAYKMPQSVHYSKMVSVLIKAIQELRQEIKELKNKL